MAKAGIKCVNSAVRQIFGTAKSQWVGGGVGGTLIFSYIRWLWSFFGVQNFEGQYLFRFSEKLMSFGV